MRSTFWGSLDLEQKFSFFRLADSRGNASVFAKKISLERVREVLEGNAFYVRTKVRAFLPEGCIGIPREGANGNRKQNLIKKEENLRKIAGFRPLYLSKPKRLERGTERVCTSLVLFSLMPK